MKEEEAIKQRFERVAGELNERTRRLLAASEAMTLGWGGISAVSRATGLSRQVISSGIKELQEEQRSHSGRVRRVGGGRKKTVSKDASLSEDLERLVEPVTRGDPESALRWTCKSVRKLAQELQQMGHRVSYQLVSELLHERGYSLQANRKTREGGEHADRDAQFEHLNAQAEAFLAADEPVISVDAKKKELIGDFKNGGANGIRTARRSRYVSMTSPSQNWAEQPRMASMTWHTMRAGSMSVSTTILQPSP